MNIINSNPLVTVLMPVFNSPDIFSSIGSVLNQEYRPIQLIIIDDCSETFAEESLRKFIINYPKCDQVAVIILQNIRNMGTVYTMNKGLLYSKGKYVINLSGDDTFTDKKVINDWVQAFEESDYKVITARRYNYDNKMERVLGTSPSKKSIFYLQNLSSERLFEKFAEENLISGASTAWNLVFLKEFGGYDKDYRLIEDYPLYLKILRKGVKIGFLNRFAINYRGGGISSEEQEISSAYESDYKKIFENEIIPYTKFPDEAKDRLRRWESSIKFNQWYFKCYNNNKNNLIVSFMLKCLYFFRHPKKVFSKYT